MLYTFTKKYPDIMTETIIFNRLPVTNPINEPRADLNAWSCCLPVYFSPKYAQINGQAINPISPNGQIVMPKIGSIITDIISPILLPRTPRLVHQNFFVPRAGMI